MASHRLELQPINGSFANPPTTEEGRLVSYLSVTPRDGRRRWVVLAVASLLCTLLGGIYNAAPAAAAPLSRTSLLTNNIQGASQTDSKWRTMVAGFIRHNAPIVMIQEAGPSGPPGATEFAPTNSNGNQVRHFVWAPGRDTTANVYFVQTDNNGGTGTGGRVNIAIVTRATPNEVIVVPNPVNAGRVALGVRFGDNWYFSIHGLSGGGNDSGALLRAIDTTITGLNANYTYTVGGDYNRDPSLLQLPAGARVYATGEATQQSGGELDYFVTNDPSAPTTGATRQNGSQSDHYPVQLGGMQAAAEPQDLRGMFNGDIIYGSMPNKTKTEEKLWWTIAESIDFKRSVDFVGSGTSSDGIPVEGASGEEISTIASRDATAIPKYKPNVVMLQAGTWDIQHGHASGAPDRLSALVDQIHDDDAAAVVIVATLAPTTNADDETQVTTFNAAVKQMVADKVAAGERVVLADLGALTTADLTADGVTLNDTGQQKVADSFTGALEWATTMGWISEPASDSQLNGSPCDIYTYYGTPCVGAYSMTRAMYSGYAGPLYQVKRSSDGATSDVGLLGTGGHVKASTQDSFCANTTCTVTELYDQSPQGNDLTIAPGGGAAPGADKGADATALSITVGGDEAYGLFITPGTGYRDNNTRGVAVNGQPEGMYMVASGTNVNDGCCYDFGNAETNTQDTGNGHMDAVNLGTKCYFAPCTGSGPWVEADLENGLFSGDNGSNLANKGNNSNFVTALLKNNGRTTYALKGGDSQSGGLSTWWQGSLPTRGGYKPMQQEGAILLGVGGDNSNWSRGSFFEGVITAGYPSDTADDAVQANIVKASYAGNSGGSATGASTSAGQAVIHDGYSSVYTVNSANGHLEESYLPKMGDPWSTQDLSAKYGTPAVMPGTKPVTLTHDGYTSVFTVDADNGHIQESYLPKMGDPWSTQDLSAKYGAPPTAWTPTAVVHDGYTSVWTVNKVNGHLQETYLPKMGAPWSTQDLSAKHGTPQVLAGSSPVAAVHTGYTSVWTVDANHHLQETYLPKMGDPWSTQDLTVEYGTPPTSVTPTAVVHQGYTSVYTVDDAGSHLQETYLPAMGDPWTTQDLSAKYGTPWVAPGTQPVALVHTGYTSVYTVDGGSNDVQETYLAGVGAPWATQDFTQKYGTPTTTETPIPLLHPDESEAVTWTSVYTVGQFNNHLEESYLPAIGDNWTFQDLSAKYGTPPVAVSQLATSTWSVVHDGYTSVYTVDASNGHLQETYLTAMNQPWATQDLSAKYGTPAVMGGVAPVAITHNGYTSVYTIDASNGHLQETYLPAMGDPWTTQDLSAKYGTPAAKTTPTAVFHDGYTSVYTQDRSNGNLWETYLPALGGPWTSQNLSAKYGTPTVDAFTSPVAIVHSGWVSVYTIDASNEHLRETYLPAIGDPWTTQDLSAKYGTPAVDIQTSLTVSVHSGFTSVYTVDNGNNHLQETYLPAIGDDWVTQDLSAKYGTPAVKTGMTPAALYHSGYASVYTVNASNGDLQETYLPAISDNWSTQDLTAKYGTPTPDQPPSPLLHFDTSGGLTWTSLFSVDGSNNHLQETYLPAIGQSWVTQDLIDKYGTPPV
ncbi:arabinofuranosidase catalytic domain-containing protein [Streptomyces sp. MUM 136J]|uniref:arabinofuranosidase catalytic domain-containing protein n=1 Tax=Streptomyces sp. MUM 136J TaxID=2791992 RepID=UPI001F03CD30|nr:arabinofuranosidase catalytic domain-containing protein [Streptomyces sp. MUM 136J]